MSVRKLLSAWNADPSVSGNFAARQDEQARLPEFCPLPGGLHPALVTALQAQGIHRLYTHQVEAWDQAIRGRDLVVVTGTASGKTLCYNLPALDRALRDNKARVLYLFPTKALAQDQAAALQDLIAALPAEERQSAPLAVYDGDTPQNDRSAIRRRARLVLSNPDMLHAGILPHHTAWAEFFQNLSLVVIDELHVYRGVFGSHVANVLRRLQRVARFYGAQPQFILTSATIANPVELAEKLIEAPVYLVERDGSARGPRSLVLYNPPVIDRAVGLRRSALQEAVRLAEDLLAYDVQTILFGRSRRTVELILTYLRDRAGAVPGTTTLLSPDETPVSKIRGYRSGYLPLERREIERGLRSGEVRAVVATNALELGVDIGALGAALLVGYPGSIAAARQQAGRAGRGLEDALAVLVATADPLDQYLAQHPEYLFDRSPEQALVNPDNLLILLDHLRCAAFELPFQTGESFGRLPADQVEEFLDFLYQSGSVHRSGDKYFWMAAEYPAQAVSLRSASADAVILQVGTALEADVPRRVIGQVDRSSALWMVHPQAVYLHEAQTYLVDELDLEQNIALMSPFASDYYTEPQRETHVELVELNAQEPVTGGEKFHGELSVSTRVVGFRKLRWYTHEQLGLGVLDLPPSILQTTGYWLALGAETVAALRAEGLWTGDRNDYGPHWQTVRAQARARAGFHCQVCGQPELERQHDVHHKTPFRAFTSHLEANRLENLLVVCRPCHQRIETAVRIRSGLAGLAFALAALAPFFLMCDPGDLGVHSDPQSPLADGAPVVVLYDGVPAGIGFSQRLFELHADLIAAAHDLVAACSCEAGCPSCVGPGGGLLAGVQVGGKAETLAILERLKADR